MTPEKRVQNGIIAYLSELEDKGHPIFFDRRQAGSFSYKKGIPDLYAVYAGIHIEIEVKRVGGTLSTMQEKWRDIFKRRGIPWMCADSVEDVKQFFRDTFDIKD